MTSSRIFLGQSDAFVPYNPDENSDGWIGVSDLLSLLNIYGSTFETGSWQTDSMSVHVDLGNGFGYLGCVNACGKIEGGMKMVNLEEFGRGLDLLQESNGLDYWISSTNALVANSPMLLKANGLGSINHVGLATANVQSGCMCFIRGNSAVPNSDGIALQESQLALEQLELQIDTLNGKLNNLLDSIPFASGSVPPLVSHISCIDAGLSTSCSPQGGLCSTVLEPVAGRFSLNRICESVYNPNVCLEPHWRKFEAHGTGLTGAVEVIFVKWDASPTGYSTYVGTQSRRHADVLNVTDTSVQFYVGMYPPPGGVDFIQLRYEWNTGDERNIAWEIAFKDANDNIIGIAPRLLFSGW